MALISHSKYLTNVSLPNLVRGIVSFLTADNAKPGRMWSTLWLKDDAPSAEFHNGAMVAILEKRLSSEVGFRGIFKKVLLFSLVAIGHIIDSKLIQTGSGIRTAVIFFYLSNEGISIIENAAKIGLPIPEKLRSVLKQLNKEDNKNESA